jgi:hypothetical protein
MLLYNGSRIAGTAPQVAATAAFIGPLVCSNPEA